MSCLFTRKYRTGIICLVLLQHNVEQAPHIFLQCNVGQAGLVYGV